MTHRIIPLLCQALALLFGLGALLALFWGQLMSRES